MTYGNLLPIPEGMRLSEWAERWIEEIYPLVQSIFDPDDLAALRDRNEKLSSYLATLTVIRSAYRDQIKIKRRDFAVNNPPPDKGIKAWEAEFEASLGEIGDAFEFINDTYESIAKRLSITQSNLRSRTAEATSIG